MKQAFRINKTTRKGYSIKTMLRIGGVTPPRKPSQNP